MRAVLPWRRRAGAPPTTTDQPRRPTSSEPAPPARSRALAVLATVAVLGGASLVVSGPRPTPALAAVQHGEGFQATVLGWTSWYGAYHLGDLGTGWCIDHGLRAPDADFGYVPTDVADAAPHVRTAIAWSASRPVAGRVDAAARMLAFHDLMGATYPFGRLDVDALGPHQLAGFEGLEGEVLARARQVKADALAHAGLTGPLRLEVSLTEVPPGTDGIAEVRAIDAAGHGVDGVEVVTSMAGGRLERTVGTTDAAGVVWFGFHAHEGEVRVAADAVVPSLTISAWASSTVPAQRIVRPDTTAVHGEATYQARPTTTTTPSTTTPPTTAPPTTAPSTTTPPTTVPPTSTTTRASTTTLPPTTTTRRATTTTTPSTSTTVPASTTTVPTSTTTAPSTTTVPTSTTTAPSTTTTVPTSTTTAPSTTTVPTSTTSSSTRPETSTTSSSTRPETTTTTGETTTTTTTVRSGAPPALPPPRPPVPRLPRTGPARATGIGLLGTGLLLGGLAAISESRRRRALTTAMVQVPSRRRG